MENVQIMAWAIIHEGVLYDLAHKKEDLVQMWMVEPTPLYWIIRKQDLNLPSSIATSQCH